MENIKKRGVKGSKCYLLGKRRKDGIMCGDEDKIKRKEARRDGNNCKGGITVLRLILEFKLEQNKNLTYLIRTQVNHQELILFFSLL